MSNNGFSPHLLTLAEDVIATAISYKIMIVTAESCTGGLVSAALTAVPGSSRTFERGFVTYSNDAKTEMLGVDPVVVNHHGAVSAETALKMAELALIKSRAHVSVSVTGIAGPGGGSEQKPVGLVHFATARRSILGEPAALTFQQEERFGDIGRNEVRLKATETALNLLKRMITLP